MNILGKKYQNNNYIYLIHRNALGSKYRRHQWRNIEQMNKKLVSQVEVFEKAFDFRNYMSKLPLTYQQKNSFRVSGGELKPKVVYPRSLEVYQNNNNKSQNDLLRSFYQMKMQQLLDTGTEIVNDDHRNDTTQDYQLQCNRIINLEILISDRDMVFKITNSDYSIVQEESFEKVLQRYPNHLCRALVQKLK